VSPSAFTHIVYIYCTRSLSVWFKVVRNSLDCKMYDIHFKTAVYPPKEMIGTPVRVVLADRRFSISNETSIIFKEIARLLAFG
jgi:hypothetical protein